MPLESVSILSASSYSCSPHVPAYSVINSSFDKHRVMEHEFLNEREEYDLLSAVENRDIISTNVISPCSDKIVGYIAGFVCLKLRRCLKCEECCQALFSHNIEDFHDLITVKKRGNLCFPSKDVFNICILCEKIFREKVSKGNELKLSNYACQAIVIQVLSTLQYKAVFTTLESHMSASDPLHNHLVLLIKAVAETYLQVRYSYAGKLFTARNIALKHVKSRTSMNKLVVYE